MLKVSRYIHLLIAIYAITLLSCRKDPPFLDAKPEPPVYGINFTIPNGWPHPVYNFQNNTLSDEGFRLGRKLFYETKLSRDNTISCGSCHQQFAGFSHSAHPVSHGIDGLLGNRNAPGLFNLAWHPLFMWDGGVNHIEVQPLGPINNPVEMDETMNNIVAKLSVDPVYLELFTRVFGNPEINSQRIFKAITQFQGMSISSNSKYDKYKRGEDGGVFTQSEKRGMEIFDTKCAVCHTPPLFSDFSFRNNGLSINSHYNDSGRAHITGLPEDRNKFKTPSLRNVEVTAPYMHDGRFKTLKQCLNHYTNEINQTENLDTILTKGISLTSQESQDIINFLETLTDDEFLRDSRFSDPN